MGTRSHNQSKSAPEPTMAAPQTTLQSRPFAPQVESAPTLEDVQSQLEHAQRFGHHLSDFAASRPEPPPPSIQAKLTIGTPGDKYEQEADRVAQQVVQRIHIPEPATPSSTQPASAVQREPNPMQHDLQLKSLLQREEMSEEDELQMKPILQLKTDAEAVDVSKDLENAIQQSRGSGQSITNSLRQPLEHAFGNVDFSGVKVHTDGQADQLNRSIQAKAFTTGQDIFFKGGEYNPGSRAGQELIAHELTHVVQQNGSAVQRHQDHHEDDVQMKPDLQLHQDHHEDDVQMKPDLQRRQESNSGSGCQCLSCTSVSSGISIQRSIQDSFKPRLIDTISIQRQVSSSSHCSGCSCANCIGANPQIQRQTEKAHSPGCSCPLCSGQGAQIQAKLIGTQIAPQANSIQRHPEKIVQLKSASPGATQKVKQTITQNTIQRHASWEHKMLGDVSPDALEIMGAARDKATKVTGMRLETTEHGSGFLKVTEGPHSGKVIDQELILHTIGQEIRRLEYFRDHPPQDASQESEEKLSDLDLGDRYKQTYAEEGPVAASQEFSEDKKWQVRLVKVPLQGGRSEVVTYGELNTLADFYGSSKELYATDPDNFHGIIQGIRQESLFKFMRLYEEISGTKTYQEKAKAAREKQAAARTTGQKVLSGAKTVGVVGLGLTGVGAIGLGGKALVDKQISDSSSEYAGLGFEGAIGNTGTGDIVGEARLMGLVPGQEGKKALKGKKETAYDAGLGRNACHFAPESWHSWAAYHERARRLAHEAWDMKVEANDMTNGLTDHRREALLANADTKAGQALIENGFGDHFLQDSYAAGHLINKTQIMQWYVKWLDTQPWKSDHQSDEEWRRIQQIAYGQQGLADTKQYDRDAVGTTEAIDPQSVENQGGDWQDRFEALGLKIPKSVTPGTPEFRFTVWWQKRTAEKNDRSLTIKVVQKEFPKMELWVVEHCLNQLIEDGVAKVKGAGIKRGQAQIGGKDMQKLTFQLRSDYVPKDLNKFKAISDGTEQGNAEYAKEMSRITYRDYHKFLNNAFLQGATNVLHDKFCKEGLLVSSKVGELPFRIYGDNSMLQKESSKGLVHSATTANMSRDTIYSIIDSGVEPYTLNAISDRFPNRVEGQSIIDWHKPGGPLMMKICHGEIFPKAQSDTVKGRVAGVKGKLTDQISKDDTDQVHSGEVF